MVDLHCQLNLIQNYLGDTPLGILWGHFERGLIVEQWPTLNVGSTVPWAGRLDCIKRERKRKPGECQNSFLLSDCGCNVTSNLVFWKPDYHVFSCHGGVYLQMVSQHEFFLPYAFYQLFYHINEKLTQRSTDPEVREERGRSTAPCGWARASTSLHGVAPFIYSAFSFSWIASLHVCMWTDLQVNWHTGGLPGRHCLGIRPRSIKAEWLIWQ